MPSALIIADLHSDLWAARGKDPLEGCDLSGIDLLLIAGDLSNKGHVQWRYALERLSSRIDLGRVHVGPGNHDYYGGRVDREDKLRDAAEAAGARFMQKTELTHEGVRFLYCTLWTDMALGGLTPDAGGGEDERSPLHPGRGAGVSAHVRAPLEPDPR